MPTRLYIGGIPPDATLEELKTRFGSFGSNVELIPSKTGGTSRSTRWCHVFVCLHLCATLVFAAVPSAPLAALAMSERNVYPFAHRPSFVGGVGGVGVDVCCEVGNRGIAYITVDEEAQVAKRMSCLRPGHRHTGW